MPDDIAVIIWATAFLYAVVTGHWADLDRKISKKPKTLKSWWGNFALDAIGFVLAFSIVYWGMTGLYYWMWT